MSSAPRPAPAGLGTVSYPPEVLARQLSRFRHRGRADWRVLVVDGHPFLVSDPDLTLTIAESTATVIRYLEAPPEGAPPGA